MAVYSYVIYTVVNPADNDFVVAFPFIAKAHVKVLVNGQPVAFTWLTDALVEVAQELLNAGDSVRIERRTPIAEPLVNYAAGADLTKANLDKSQLQSLYVAQESWDSLTGQMQPDIAGNWDALGHRVVNMAAPVAATDAATKEYADATAVQAAVSAAAADAARVLSEGARDTSVAAKDVAVTAAANAELARAAAVVAKEGAEAAEAGAEAVLATAVKADVFTAAWDMLVGSGPATYVKKTLADVWTYITGNFSGAYTKPQRSVPVNGVVTNGVLNIDARATQDILLHNYAGTALTIALPTNGVLGDYITITGNCAYGTTLAWSSGWIGSRPTSIRKWTWYNFSARCLDPGIWLFLGMSEAE